MSMNKKTRSLINTRYEAQKIYYQRKEIKRKEKEIKELNNVKEFYKGRSLDYKQRIDKAVEYMKYNATSNYFDKDKNMFHREIDLLNILQDKEKV